MFGRAVFEVFEVKKRDFDDEKNQNECKKIKHPILICKMPYCHFHARNGSKTEKVKPV